MSDAPKAPFPYFGGKSRVADVVWRRFGAVRNYVEPFCGSAAVLLARPEPIEGAESIGDLDGSIVNVWRALKQDAEAVAHFCMDPPNSFDMGARGDVLTGAEEHLPKQLLADPEWCDLKLAGFWLYCQACWLNGRESARGRTPMPRLWRYGMGVARYRDDAELLDDLRALQRRLRYVRVCYGDWKRLTTPAALQSHGVSAIFCLHPLTPVRLEDERIERISAIRPGEIVHGGRRVRSVLARPYEGLMLEFSIQGVPDKLCVTPEHRVLRIPKRSTARQDYRTSEGLWRRRALVAARDVEVGDLLLVPLGGIERPVEWSWSTAVAPHGKRQKEVCFAPSPDLYRLLGYYAAEGCVRCGGGRPQSVQLTFGRTEETGYVADVVELCEAIFGLRPTKRYSNPGAVNLHLGSTSVAAFFHHYVPGDARTKRLAPELLTAPMKLQRELLLGWLRGDGGIAHWSRNRAKLTGTTASEGLARDMMTLAWRCGLRPSFKHREANHDVYFASEDAKWLGWPVAALKFRSTRRVVHDHLLTRVRAVEDVQYRGLVYDLDVDGDDLIVASGVLVHNCDPPYGVEDRYELYTKDSRSVSREVYDWARANEDDPLLRICVAGYEGEHDFPDTWAVVKWRSHGFVGKAGSQGRLNRDRERLWFSPHCLSAITERTTQLTFGLASVTET